MKISLGKKLGTVTKGRVAEYRRNPGSDNEACHAAVFYAKKNKQNMVVVPGNSFGSFVLHIAKETDDLRKYIPGVGDKEISVYFVNVDGEVFEATAAR